MRKINSKGNLIFTILFLILIYTRFVNIGWGLPYPMHPDERNMADAVQQLHCEFSNLKECLNPHFFAYGQFPLYLSYFNIQILHFFTGKFGQPISFIEATIVLRLLSAISSIVTVLILLKITQFLTVQKKFSILTFLFSLLVIIFSPVLIQFAHFGTTESLLILFYSLIIYSSLLFLHKKILNSKFLTLNSIFSGLALATKVSSLFFLMIPLYCIFTNLKTVKGKFTAVKQFLFISMFIFILFSPHNLISFNEFMSSMRYESGVAVGQIKVFYTRQFENTLPIIFQITKIFPYALGWTVFLLGLLGIFFLSWKQKAFNLLRIAFALAFFPSAFMYAKWTRFMAPAFPILIIFAILFLEFSIFNFQFLIKTKLLIFLAIFIVLMSIIPGIAYLSIYQNPDVRFQASKWIFKNIPNRSYILSETANVVDIPVKNEAVDYFRNYRIISFNFYDLDQDPVLQEDLQYYLRKADYIFVPSRRIFKNNINRYPLLFLYYQNLFSEKFGFKEIAEFHSYPTFKFQILNFKFQKDFPDEDAEETWTVFDHPVIRIYSRLPNNLKFK